MVRVIDRGIGITPEERDTIFRRFGQGAALDGRNEAGLGIGLALVRGLVGLHGGTVDVASAGRGAGSTFTVTLPPASAPAPVAAPA